MEAYLDKSIKEVINQFPAVEKILDEYGIGCGPCSVGSCLLKDIVEIHSLPEDQEREMMARIASLIHSGKVIKIPPARKKAEPRAEGIKYSPPLKKLVQEHALIKRWVALIPEVARNLDMDSKEGRQLVLDGVDFIRSYADKYHHGKEEEILFKYFDENLDILQVMHEDHKQARARVRAILEALDRKDKEGIAEHLTAYGALLTEHIRKEDDILYPWMDKNLSMAQIGELFSKFHEADEQIGYPPTKYEAFVNHLEKKFRQQEVLK
jgi:hemerythrin-like domain-containing protein